MEKLTDQNTADCAEFYYFLCLLIESDLFDLLKTMFPGTWSGHKSDLNKLSRTTSEEGAACLPEDRTTGDYDQQSANDRTQETVINARIAVNSSCDLKRGCWFTPVRWQHGCRVRDPKCGFLVARPVRETHYNIAEGPQAGKR